MHSCSSTLSQISSKNSLGKVFFQILAKTEMKRNKIRLFGHHHQILIKFRQLVVNIVIKELQMVSLTSTVINSNGNMNELERKIKCEKLMFPYGI